MIMRYIKDLDGIRTGRVNRNNSRYANDTTLIADSEQKLQQFFDVVVEESERKGLDINKKKSGLTVFSKKENKPTYNTKVKSEVLEQADHFIYLGSMVTSDGRCDIEIKRRLELRKLPTNSWNVF